MAIYNIIYFMVCSLPLGVRVIIIIIRDLDPSNNNNNNIRSRLIDPNLESGIRYRNRITCG